MSKSINVPTVTINDNISNLKASSVSSSVSTDSTTGRLARHFLDSNIYIKTRIAILKSKKHALDEEIFKFHQIYQENKSVKALGLFNEMTLQHLTNLMKEFLDINQQILDLESQLVTNLAHIESNLVN